MELIFLPVAIIVLLTPPLLSALFAKRMGRNTLIWFIIGCFLPIIANFILFFLPEKTLTELSCQTSQAEKIIKNQTV